MADGFFEEPLDPFVQALLDLQEKFFGIIVLHVFRIMSHLYIFRDLIAGEGEGGGFEHPKHSLDSTL